MSVKLGVAATLANYLYPDECPFAVVLDLYDWKPSQPPPGSEWDYEPFPTLERAVERARDLRPAEANAEIWQYGEAGWAQVAV